MQSTPTGTPAGRSEAREGTQVGKRDLRTIAGDWVRPALKLAAEYAIYLSFCGFGWLGWDMGVFAAIVVVELAELYFEKTVLEKAHEGDKKAMAWSVLRYVAIFSAFAITINPIVGLQNFFYFFLIDHLKIRFWWDSVGDIHRLAQGIKVRKSGPFEDLSATAIRSLSKGDLRSLENLTAPLKEGAIFSQIRYGWRRAGVLALLRQRGFQIPEELLSQPAWIQYFDAFPAKNAAREERPLLDAVRSMLRQSRPETGEQDQMPVARSEARNSASLEFERVDESEGLSILNNVKTEIHGSEYWGKTLTKQMLAENHLWPQFRAVLFGREIIYSQAFDIGSSRTALIGYVRDGDKYVARTYYLSRSQVLWRYLPLVHLNKEGKIDLYDKGYDQDSLNVPYQVQALFSKILTHGTLIFEHLSEKQRNLLFVGTAYVREPEQGGDEGDTAVRPTYADEVIATPDFKMAKPNVSLRDLKDPNLSKIRVPRGQSPALDQKLAQFKVLNAFGEWITLRVYPSKDSTLNYIFAEDPQTRVWIAGIEVNSLQVNKVGIRTDWIEGGLLTMPLYEYSGYDLNFGDETDSRKSYVGMWKNFLSKIPMIQDYLRHRADEDRALSEADTVIPTSDTERPTPDTETPASIPEEIAANQRKPNFDEEAKVTSSRIAGTVPSTLPVRMKLGKDDVFVDVALSSDRGIFEITISHGKEQVTKKLKRFTAGIQHVGRSEMPFRETPDVPKPKWLEEISRRHLKITTDPEGHIRFEDLMSTNGTEFVTSPGRPELRERDNVNARSEARELDKFFSDNVLRLAILVLGLMETAYKEGNLNVVEYGIKYLFDSMDKMTDEQNAPILVAMAQLPMELFLNLPRAAEDRQKFAIFLYKYIKWLRAFDIFETAVWYGQTPHAVMVTDRAARSETRSERDGEFDDPIFIAAEQQVTPEGRGIAAGINQVLETSFATRVDISYLMGLITSADPADVRSTLEIQGGVPSLQVTIYREDMPALRLAFQDSGTHLFSNAPLQVISAAFKNKRPSPDRSAMLVDKDAFLTIVKALLGMHRDGLVKGGAIVPTILNRFLLYQVPQEALNDAVDHEILNGEQSIVDAGIRLDNRRDIAQLRASDPANPIDLLMREGRGDEMGPAEVTEVAGAPEDARMVRSTGAEEEHTSTTEKPPAEEIYGEKEKTVVLEAGNVARITIAQTVYAVSIEKIENQQVFLRIGEEKEFPKGARVYPLLMRAGAILNVALASGLEVAFIESSGIEGKTAVKLHLRNPVQLITYVDLENQQMAKAPAWLVERLQKAEPQMTPQAMVEVIRPLLKGAIDPDVILGAHTSYGNNGAIVVTHALTGSRWSVVYGPYARSGDPNFYLLLASAIFEVSKSDKQIAGDWGEDSADGYQSFDIFLNRYFEVSATLRGIWKQLKEDAELTATLAEIEKEQDLYADRSRMVRSLIQDRLIPRIATLPRAPGFMKKLLSSANANPVPALPKWLPTVMLTGLAIRGVIAVAVHSMVLGGLSAALAVVGIAFIHRIYQKYLQARQDLKNRKALSRDLMNILNLMKNYANRTARSEARDDGVLAAGPERIELPGWLRGLWNAVSSRFQQDVSAPQVPESVLPAESIEAGLNDDKTVRSSKTGVEYEVIARINAVGNVEVFLKIDGVVSEKPVMRVGISSGGEILFFEIKLSQVYFVGAGQQSNLTGHGLGPQLLDLLKPLIPELVPVAMEITNENAQKWIFENLTFQDGELFFHGRQVVSRSLPENQTKEVALSEVLSQAPWIQDLISQLGFEIIGMDFIGLSGLVGLKALRAYPPIVSFDDRKMVQQFSINGMTLFRSKVRSEIRLLTPTEQNEFLESVRPVLASGRKAESYVVKPENGQVYRNFPAGHLSDITEGIEAFLRAIKKTGGLDLLAAEVNISNSVGIMGSLIYSYARNKNEPRSNIQEGKQDLFLAALRESVSNLSKTLLFIRKLRQVQELSKHPKESPKKNRSEARAKDSKGKSRDVPASVLSRRRAMLVGTVAAGVVAIVGLGITVFMKRQGFLIERIKIELKKMADDIRVAHFSNVASNPGAVIHQSDSVQGRSRLLISGPHAAVQTMGTLLAHLQEFYDSPGEWIFFIEPLNRPGDTNSPYPEEAVAVRIAESLKIPFMNIVPDPWDPEVLQALQKEKGWSALDLASYYVFRNLMGLAEITSLSREQLDNKTSATLQQMAAEFHVERTTLESHLFKQFEGLREPEKLRKFGQAFVSYQPEIIRAVNERAKLRMAEELGKDKSRTKILFLSGALHAEVAGGPSAMDRFKAQGFGFDVGMGVRVLQISDYLQGWRQRSRSEVRTAKIRDMNLPKKIPDDFVMLAPVFNEGKNKAVDFVLMIEKGKTLGYSDRIIYVDDGSTDETPAILKAAGVFYISFDRNQQKEGAIRAAMDYLKANLSLPEYLVAFDGGDSFLEAQPGSIVTSEIQKAVAQLKGLNRSRTKMFVAQPIKIETRASEKPTFLEKVQAVMWRFSMSQSAMAGGYIPGGGEIYRTENYYQALRNLKLDFESGVFQLTKNLKKQGALAPFPAAMVVRTGLMPDWSSYWSQQARFARGNLASKLWLFPVTLAMLPLVMMAVLGVFIEHPWISSVTTVVALSIMPYWAVGVMIQTTAAWIASLRMIAVMISMPFKRFRTQKSARPAPETTTKRSEARSSDLDRVLPKLHEEHPQKGFGSMDELLHRKINIPKGYREIAVVMESRGRNYGVVGAIVNLTTDMLRYYKGEGLKIRVLVPAEMRETEVDKRFVGSDQDDFENFRNMLPAEVELETYDDLAKAPSADVAIYYGNDYLSIPHIKKTGFKSKMAVHVPLLAYGFDKDFGRYAHVRDENGTRHHILLAGRGTPQNMSLILNTDLTERSLAIGKMETPEIIQLRKEIMRKISVSMGIPTLLAEDDYTLPWALAYAQSPTRLRAYKQALSAAAKKSGRNVVLFQVRGKEMGDARPADPDNVITIDLKPGFSIKELFNEILLLTGEVIGDGGLRGAVPVLMTGTQSLFEAKAALKVCLHDGQNIDPGLGDEVMRYFYQNALVEFRSKYNPDNKRGIWPLLFEANSQTVQEDYLRELVPFLAHNNMVDSLAALITEDANGGGEKIPALSDVLNGQNHEAAAIEKFLDDFFEGRTLYGRVVREDRDPRKLRKSEGYRRLLMRLDGADLRNPYLEEQTVQETMRPDILQYWDLLKLFATPFIKDYFIQFVPNGEEIVPSLIEAGIFEVYKKWDGGLKLKADIELEAVKTAIQNITQRVVVKEYSMGEFGQFEYSAKHDIQRLLEKMGVGFGEESAAKAVLTSDPSLWMLLRLLNTCTKPFADYRKYLESNLPDQDIKPLLPEDFKDSSNNDAALALTLQGQLLKRAIINKLYPKEAPQRTVFVRVMDFLRQCQADAVSKAMEAIQKGHLLIIDRPDVGLGWIEVCHKGPVITTENKERSENRTHVESVAAEGHDKGDKARSVPVPGASVTKPLRSESRNKVVEDAAQLIANYWPNREQREAGLSEAIEWVNRHIKRIPGNQLGGFFDMRTSSRDLPQVIRFLTRSGFYIGQGGWEETWKSIAGRAMALDPKRTEGVDAALEQAKIFERKKMWVPAWWFYQEALLMGATEARSDADIARLAWEKELREKGFKGRLSDGQVGQLVANTDLGAIQGNYLAKKDRFVLVHSDRFLGDFHALVFNGDLTAVISYDKNGRVVALHGLAAPVLWPRVSQADVLLEDGGKTILLQGLVDTDAAPLPIQDVRVFRNSEGPLEVGNAGYDEVLKRMEAVSLTRFEKKVAESVVDDCISRGINAEAIADMIRYYHTVSQLVGGAREFLSPAGYKAYKFLREYLSENDVMVLHDAHTVLLLKTIFKGLVEKGHAGRGPEALKQVILSGSNSERIQAIRSLVYGYPDYAASQTELFEQIFEDDSDAKVLVAVLRETSYVTEVFRPLIPKVIPLLVDVVWREPARFAILRALKSSPEELVRALTDASRLAYFFSSFDTSLLSEEVSPTLIRALKEGPTESARKQAAAALGEMVKASGVTLESIRSALQEAARVDKKKTVRAAATSALENLLPQARSEIRQPPGKDKLPDTLEGWQDYLDKRYVVKKDAAGKVVLLYQTDVLGRSVRVPERIYVAADRIGTYERAVLDSSIGYGGGPYVGIWLNQLIGPKLSDEDYSVRLEAARIMMGLGRTVETMDLLIKAFSAALGRLPKGDDEMERHLVEVELKELASGINNLATKFKFVGTEKKLDALISQLKIAIQNVEAAPVNSAAAKAYEYLQHSLDSLKRAAAFDVETADGTRKIKKPAPKAKTQKPSTSKRSEMRNSPPTENGPKDFRGRISKGVSRVLGQFSAMTWPAKWMAIAATFGLVIVAIVSVQRTIHSGGRKLPAPARPIPVRPQVRTNAAPAAAPVAKPAPVFKFSKIAEVYRYITGYERLWKTYGAGDLFGETNMQAVNNVELFLAAAEVWLRPREDEEVIVQKNAKFPAFGDAQLQLNRMETVLNRVYSWGDSPLEKGSVQRRILEQGSAPSVNAELKSIAEAINASGGKSDQSIRSRITNLVLNRQIGPELNRKFTLLAIFQGFANKASARGLPAIFIPRSAAELEEFHRRVWAYGQGFSGKDIMTATFLSKTFFVSSKVLEDPIYQEQVMLAVDQIQPFDDAFTSLWANLQAVNNRLRIAKKTKKACASPKALTLDFYSISNLVTSAKSNLKTTQDLLRPPFLARELPSLIQMAANDAGRYERWRYAYGAAKNIETAARILGGYKPDFDLVTRHLRLAASAMKWVVAIEYASDIRSGVVARGQAASAFNEELEAKAARLSWEKGSTKPKKAPGTSVPKKGKKGTARSEMRGNAPFSVEELTQFSSGDAKLLDFSLSQQSASLLTQGGFVGRSYVGDKAGLSLLELAAAEAYIRKYPQMDAEGVSNLKKAFANYAWNWNCVLSPVVGKRAVSVSGGMNLLGAILTEVQPPSIKSSAYRRLLPTMLDPLIAKGSSWIKDVPYDAADQRFLDERFALVREWIPNTALDQLRGRTELMGNKMSTLGDLVLKTLIRKQIAVYLLDQAKTDLEKQQVMGQAQKIEEALVNNGMLFRLSNNLQPKNGKGQPSPNLPGYRYANEKQAGTFESFLGLIFLANGGLENGGLDYAEDFLAPQFRNYLDLHKNRPDLYPLWAPALNILSNWMKSSIRSELRMELGLETYLQANTHWLERENALTQDDFKKLHEWVSLPRYQDGVHDVTTNPSWGEPLNIWVGYRNFNYEGKDYLGVPFKAIGEAMEKFVAWFNATASERSARMDPARIAAESFLRLIDIHPFGDSNGRTSRLLINAVLARFGDPLIDLKLLPWDDESAIGYSDILPQDADHLAVLIRRAQQGFSSVGIPYHGDHTASRSEARLGKQLLFGTAGKRVDIEKIALRGDVDGVRTETVKRAEVRFGEMKGKFDEQATGFIKDLEKRSELREYVLSDAFPEVLQAMFGEFGDTGRLTENIQRFVSGIEGDSSIMKVLPAEMVRLIGGLSAVEKGSAYTLGAEVPKTGESRMLMEKLVRVLSERAGLVNELAISGRSPGAELLDLKDRGIAVRQTNFTKPFEPRNAQSVVPVVMNSSSSADEAFNAVFAPVTADVSKSADPYLREYVDLLKVVAAIHWADITSGKNAALLKQPVLLKAKLLKRLFVSEQSRVQDLIQMNASGGFTIMSASVRLYLQMRAEASIAAAA